MRQRVGKEEGRGRERERREGKIGRKDKRGGPKGVGEGRGRQWRKEKRVGSTIGWKKKRARREVTGWGVRKERR